MFIQKLPMVTLVSTLLGACLLLLFVAGQAAADGMDTTPEPAVAVVQSAGVAPRVRLQTEVTALGDIAYFIANRSSNTGHAAPTLWRTDGSETGTELVYTFDEDLRSVQISATFGDRLVLTLDEADGTRALWLSDGTEAGTELLHDAADEMVLPWFEAQGWLYFTTYQADEPVETWTYSLYRTAGTPASTELLEVPGLTDMTDFTRFPPYPFRQGHHSTRLYFELSLNADKHLWYLEEETFHHVRSFPGSEDGSDWFRFGRHIVVRGEAAYFLGEDVDGTAGLWRSDGTAEGTALVYAAPLTDLLADHPSGLDIEQLFLLDTGVVLLEYREGKVDVLRFNLDDESTELLTTIESPFGSILIGRGTSLNHDGWAYFTATAGERTLSLHTTLWRTDGTVAGTTARTVIGRPNPYALTATDEGVYVLGRVGQWHSLKVATASAPHAATLRDLGLQLILWPTLSVAGDHVYFADRLVPDSEGPVSEERVLWRIDTTQFEVSNLFLPITGR